MKINILDLFSGIGGFSLGLKQAGFSIENHYFSEIDKHAIAIYKKQFPEAKHVGSVTNVRGKKIPKIDGITFGSPCQDFSLAGKRKGLEGNRSNLVGQAIRLINECKPKFFIWENVKGAYSSNDGADFWAIIQAFANIGGYRLEWQLLNTAWFLPQNRERIYLVGYNRDECGRSVFPIGKNIERVDERAVETATVRTLTGGGNSGGMHSSMTLLNFLKNNQKRIKGWRENKNTIHAYQGDTKKSTCSEHVYHKLNGVSQNLSCAHIHKVIIENAIRRLTEIECERLQGFPDDWTKNGDYDGLIKKISPTQRYKCLGNAVSVPVVKAVGENILKIFND